MYIPDVSDFLNKLAVSGLLSFKLILLYIPVVSDFLNKLVVSALFSFKLILLYIPDVSDFLNKLAVSEMFNFRLILFEILVVSTLEAPVEKLNFDNCAGVTYALALSALFNLRSNAVWVDILIGLEESAVLLTLSKESDDFKVVKLFEPVPPRATGTMPDIFSASTLFANMA